MKLFFDFFPIIAFFIAYKTYDIYAATVVAIAAVVLQVGFSLFKGKKPELLVPGTSDLRRTVSIVIAKLKSGGNWTAEITVDPLLEFGELARALRAIAPHVDASYVSFDTAASSKEALWSGDGDRRDHHLVRVAIADSKEHVLLLPVRRRDAKPRAQLDAASSSGMAPLSMAKTCRGSSSSRRSVGCKLSSSRKPTRST